ncbi:hypothetical protein EV702DRAFT_1146773 [Suillus placidus]|uniref:Uncharacterized protein n=1 Tax=Suillus placidus TaxID=48579 RepID=A0A9P6ZJ72_9AGAM|nr:hypothetical protein EV702DRAFT_1146773 [Suillus placidus]
MESFPWLSDPTMGFAGFAGSALIACGIGVISDLFSEPDRAAAMALYNVGPLLDPFHSLHVHTHLPRSRHRPRHGRFHGRVAWRTI